MFQEPHPNDPYEVLRLKEGAEFLCVLTRPTEDEEDFCLAALKALLDDPRFPPMEEIDGIFLRVGSACAESLTDIFCEEEESPAAQVMLQLLDELAARIPEEVELAMSCNDEALMEPGGELALFIAARGSMEPPPDLELF